MREDIDLPSLNHRAVRHRNGTAVPVETFAKALMPRVETRIGPEGQRLFDYPIPVGLHLSAGLAGLRAGSHRLAKNVLTADARSQTFGSTSNPVTPARAAA